MRSITLADYLMGRDIKYILHPDVKTNAEYTVEKANKLFSYLTSFGIELQVNPKTKSLITSGWRPAEVNAGTHGAAPKSKHITGCAVDIYDPDGEIDEWLMENTWLLKELDLYMEHPSATKGWCHVQTIPPRSGKFIFYP